MAEGLLYRRRVWTRQPTAAVGTDRQSTLIRGLVGLYGADRNGGLRNLAGTRGILTAGGSGSQYAATDRGHAIRLNGSGYYQDQTFSLATTVGRTMACWVRMNALPASNANVICWTDGTSVLSIEQLSITSTGVVRVESYRGGTAGVANTVGAVAVGRWHFIAAVMPSDASRTAWLDTESVTASSSAGVMGADKWITIGAAPWASYTDTANADILLPMVWDRGLSAQEIAQVRANSWRLIAPANSPVFYSLPGGGSTYPVSLTANGTISASATRSILRLTSASSTSSASMTRVRALLRSASATATASASASKHVSLARAATATGTASVSKVRALLSSLSASSAVTASLSKVLAIARTITASATVTAARGRVVGLIRSASTTASATRARVVGLSRSATATGTAALTTIKAVLRTLSATAAASASQLKGVARIVTATATVTATRSRLIALARAAGATASATRTKIVSLTRSATATGAASLAKVKAVLRTLTATATASAALARDLRRLVTATVTATAIRSRVISMARTASSTATAVRSRVVRLARSASATGSAALTTVKQTARLLSATATATATLAKLLQKRLIATWTIQGVLTLVSSAAQQGQIAVDRLRIRIMPALRAIRRFRDG